MPAPRARHIPQLLDIHAEDLAFLWGQRRAALDSPEETLRSFAQLAERIEAHIQGLLIAPAGDLARRLEAALAGGDRDDVFAAAIACARCDDAATQHLVVTEFSRASANALLGLRDALGQAPARRVADELRNALAHAKPAVAAAAAVALANLKLLVPDAPGLGRLLLDDEAAVATQAWAAAWRADWHAATAASASAPATGATRPYREALARPEAAVRHEAWAAVAWSGPAGAPQALAALRRAGAGVKNAYEADNASSANSSNSGNNAGAHAPDEVALHWLCVLGTADDTKTLGAATMALPTADQRCAALARYGHPAALPALVRWMEGDDALAAHAAGTAFTRITGCAIEGERKTLPVPDDADEIDREMAPLVWMPDAAKARRLLGEHNAQWNAATRWCAGRRVDVPFGPDDLAPLDLQARWDVAARAASAGRPVCAPPPIV